MSTSATVKVTKGRSTVPSTAQKYAVEGLTVNEQDLESAQPTNMTLVARIQSLGAGECCSESRFIDFNATDRETLDQVVKALRSTVNKAVSRAAARTGADYSTVTGHYMTRDNNIIVVATALRTG